MAMSSLFQQFLSLSLSTTLLSLSPTLSAIHTLEKHRHRLIRRSRLLLHVLRFIGSTSSALNKRSPQNALPWSLRRVCSSCASCTNRSDTLRTFPLWSFLSAIQRKNTLIHLLPDIIAHHLFRCHRRKFFAFQLSKQPIAEQLPVFLQVEANVAEMLSVVGRNVVRRRIESGA